MRPQRARVFGARWLLLGAIVASVGVSLAGSGAVVAAAAATPTVTVTARGGNVCDSEVVTAIVTPPLSGGGGPLPTPTGVVRFTVGSATMSGTLDATGSTTVTFVGLPNGNLAAFALYRGDANYLAATGRTMFTVSCSTPTSTTTTPAGTTTLVTTTLVTTNPATTRAPIRTTPGRTAPSTPNRTNPVIAAGPIPTAPPPPTSLPASTTGTLAPAGGVTATTIPAGPAQLSTRAAPSLAVSTSADQPFGPPGVGLNLSGSNYPPTCSTVYVFFDGTRFGSAHPDRSGNLKIGGLSVPGNASAGDHQVTSSCRGGGRPVLAAAHFAITPSDVHRSSFVTSVNQPRQILLTLRTVRSAALITAFFLIFVGFPSQVFNATLQEHYEEVRGWFHLRRPISEVVGDLNQRILLPIFLAAGGVLYALITPEFGLNRSTLALALGMAVAVAVTTIGFAVPTAAYFGLRFRDRAQILVMPGTVLVAAVLVVMSRLLHFQPGYLYGLLAVFVFHHRIDSRTEGRLAALAALLVMVMAFAAWVARVPVSGATLRPGVGFWAVVAESALCGVFVIGLQGTVVGLLPMRFLDGSRIKEWNRTAWALLLSFAIFLTVLVFIEPGTGYVGRSTTVTKLTALCLFVAFGSGSVAFWAYFRYRPERAPSGELEFEGDHGVR